MIVTGHSKAIFPSHIYVKPHCNVLEFGYMECILSSIKECVDKQTDRVILVTEA